METILKFVFVLFILCLLEGIALYFGFNYFAAKFSFEPMYFLDALKLGMCLNILMHKAQGVKL